MTLSLENSITKTASTVVVVFTLMGVYFCLSPYLVPTDLNAKITLFLYGEEYTKNAIPAISNLSFTEFMHRVLGAIYLVIGLLQFNISFRNKFIGLHRLLGKIFILLTLTAGASAIILVLFVPFSGPLESIPVFLFATIMLYSIYRAYKHIRKKEIMQHKAWMLKTYAIGLGIVPLRIIAFILLNTTTIEDQNVLILSMYLGWGLSFAVAMWYGNLFYKSVK